MKVAGALLLIGVAIAGNAFGGPRGLGITSDAALRHMLSIPPDARLLFRDRHGAVIDEKTFLAAVNSDSGISWQPPDESGLVVLTLSAGTPPPKPHTSLGDLIVGEPLPTFTLPSSQGRTVSIDHLDHDLTVVNFFYYDCTGCIAEIPALNAFHADHPDIGALAVTYDPRVRLSLFQQKYGLTWEIVPDAVAFFEKANITMFPMLGIVDRHGRLLDLRGSWTLHPPGAKLTGDDVAHWVATVKAQSTHAP